MPKETGHRSFTVGASIRRLKRPWLVPAWAFLVCLTLASPTVAHLWYPKKCCNDQDCFRATTVEHLPDGSLRIESGPIEVIVPPGFPALTSQDNDAHVCVYRDIMGRYHPRCVFLPGVG
jgi:hypothetical protein